MESKTVTKQKSQSLFFSSETINDNDKFKNILIQEKTDKKTYETNIRVCQNDSQKMCWKLLYPPPNLQLDNALQKKKIFRVNGICDAQPQHNIVLLHDPRNAKKKLNVVESLMLPQFLIDNNYCAIPYKREFSIIGLNDNINESFLRGLCKKDVEPCEVIIYYHPVTKKHLSMAFMDFDSKLQSDAFIQKFNGKTMMGSTVTCFFDPLAYKVSKVYEKITNTSAPIPKRYENIKYSQTFSTIQNLLEKKYLKQKTSKWDFNEDNCNGKIDDLIFKISSFEENLKKKNTNDIHKRCAETTVSYSSTLLTEDSDNFKKSQTFPNENFQCHNNEKKTLLSKTSQQAINGASDLKNLSSQDRLPKKEFLLKNDASFGDNDLKTTSDSVIFFLEEQNIQNKENRNSIETHLDTDSSSDNNLLKVKKNLKKASNVKLCVKKDKLKHVQKKKQRTHRWSSTSDSCSSEDEKKNKKMLKKSLNSTQFNSSTENQENQSAIVLNCLPSSSASASTTSTPHAHLSSFSPSFVTPAHSITSFCSPRQANSFGINITGTTTSKAGASCSSMSTSNSKDFTKKNFYHNEKNIQTLNSSEKFQNFSTSHSFQTNYFKEYLPPPALINPPIPATKTYLSHSINAHNITPTKARNLEQRLLQIFGKTSDNKIDTQNYSSMSSFMIPSQNGTPLHSSTANASSSINSLFYLSSYQNDDKLSQNTIIYNNSYNYPPPPPPIDDETTEQARIAAEAKEKLQEKMMKCFDICKKARNTLEVDLKIIIQKDLQRRLEAEAFKMLDEEYQKIETKQNFKKNELKLFSNTLKSTNSLSEKKTDTMLVQAKENSSFFNIFTALDNSNDDNSEGHNNIFGISYSERMRTLPSFKKKKILEIDKLKSFKSKTSNYDRRKEKDLNQKKKNKYDIKTETSTSTIDKEYKSKIQETSKTNKGISYKESTLPNIKKTMTDRRCSVESSSEISISDNDEKKKKKNLKLSISEVSSNNTSQASSDNEEMSDKEIDTKQNKKNLNISKEKTIKNLENSDDEVEIEKVKLKSTRRKRAFPDNQVDDLEKKSFNNTKAEKNDKTNFMTAKRSKLSHELSALLENQATYLSTTASTGKKETLKIWPKRTEDEELKILNKIHNEVINDEDCNFLKIASIKLSKFLNQFMPEGRNLMWVQPYIVRSPQKLPKPIKQDNVEIYYDDPELNGIILHQTGSARTEGYYKINKQRKTIMRRFEDDMYSRNIISTQDEIAVRHKTQAAKDERAMNRRLLTYMGDNALLRVNQLKYRSKMIKFARSRIHGWGLYALETISIEEMIIEYVGEKIRPTIADEREKNYERRGQGSSYMFRIDGDAVIDATQMGNYGRFINHSCSPNCTARVVMVDGEKRIVIYSKRLIEKGEEITYDYKFAREDEASKIECLCGSKCCQKYLN